MLLVGWQCHRNAHTGARVSTGTHADDANDGQELSGWGHRLSRMCGILLATVMIPHVQA